MQFHFVFQECPSGVVNEETFKDIYAQFFPQGGVCHVSLLICFCSLCCCFLSRLCAGLTQIAFQSCLEKWHQVQSTFKLKLLSKEMCEREGKNEKVVFIYAGWSCSLLALFIMQKILPEEQERKH